MPGVWKEDQVKSPGSRERDRLGTLRLVLRTICLVLPFVALLPLPLYARVAPRWGGFPFFYWYQFAWIPGCSLALLAAYLLRNRSHLASDSRSRR